ncbi:MAG: IPT/TIG domain-containing protein, partial [Actinobacteria bacterium]|nr:IPT/TIG domain-containing protein [Actinomycetota bacterium]
MRNRGLIRKVAIIGCLAMLVTLLPLLTLPASAAAWDQVANNGGTNPNNKFALPGEEFQGNLTVGSIWLPGIVLPPPGPVSMYTYNGNAFTQVPTGGLEDSVNNSCLISTAEYDGELQIGTSNINIGSELYTWVGTGNPAPVPDSHHGWGVGGANDTTIPLGVINNELVVSVQNNAGAPDGGCRMYKYDGSNWTQIIGQGAPGTPTGPGFGDFDNTTVVMPMGETILYQDKMILVVQNLAAGKGLSVYTYDGSSFTLIGKAGDPGVWTTDNKMGGLTTSLVDGKVYMGTDKDPAAGQGGEMWSYDGTGWTEVVGPSAGTPAAGLGDPNSFALVPLARGSDLYVASWNIVGGCRIYKRDGGNFNTISDINFGQGGADLNEAAILKSYQGKLYACTANDNGYEIWRTDIPPSIDRLVPNSGPYGATVAIEGHDFMSQQGNGTVTFNGAEAPDVLSWSDTRIEVMVPPKATAGPVQVMQSNGDSNEVGFTVTLSDTYYFAEGTTRDNATDGTYEQWLCLQNPGATVAKVTLTYMLEDGTTEVQNVSVDPESRFTVSVNDFLGPDKDVSTLVESDQLILAERPMYFNYRSKWTGGHDVMGVPAPRDTYYFAEGTTRDNVYDGTYEEWLGLQNPGATKAEVTVTYMLEDGTTEVQNVGVDPESRFTVSVNAFLGPDKAVSTLVESDQLILAERPMYFNYRSKWTGGHDVM